MNEEPLLTNISEMIDLAIGTPEIGVVDFSMLQTVLHCLAQQLRVSDKNVELRGSMAALNICRPTEKDQILSINEFIINTKAPGGFELATQPPSRNQQSMLVVERKHKFDPEFGPEESPTGPEAMPTAVPISVGTQGPNSMTAFSETGPSSEKISLVTISKFNLLEETVADLKLRVYGTSPKNEEILEEVRSQSNMKAITDMWTNMNVSSRLDATEEGIGKLSSLIEDLIAETVELQKATGGKPSAATARMAEVAKAVTKEAQSPRGTKGTQATFDTSPATITANLQQLRNDLDLVTQTFYKYMKEVNPDFVPPVGQSTLPVGGEGGAAIQLDGSVMEKFLEMEKQLKMCCDDNTKSSGLVNDQLTSFQDQLESMAKQIANFTGGDMGLENLSPEVIQDLRGLMHLLQTVQDMQAQLQEVHDTALQLAAEKEERQSHIDALLEQIELLKAIKLDREDMVEALADKADLRMLARKVSHDQFESACDDLSKGLEHALGKLNVQEALWQQALDDIQREIETKLDKIELSPVKDFFNKKLKQLQENLKQMAALRREVEAAGTKRRLLRDVNCISCDAKAVMPMDAHTLVHPKPLPGSLSMKPYLSYELDAIRKTQASGLPQRNLHDWEHIDKQMQPTKPLKVRSEKDKHLCNRYCGGSHTVTTPAQRVARLGHFIKQWGPEVLPLSSGYAAGGDGRLYKITTTEGANVGQGGAEGAAPCTPKSGVKKPDTSQFSKPITISAECRCLDPVPERPPKS